MQVDDIGTLKLAQLGDVGASVGYVYLEKVPAAESVVNKNAKPFPQEFERLCQTVAHGEHSNVVGLLVAHQHFSLDTILFQGFHQSVGSDSRTANSFGSIDDKYSHIAKLSAKLRFFVHLFIFFNKFFVICLVVIGRRCTFATLLKQIASVAQLVRAHDC